MSAWDPEGYICALNDCPYLVHHHHHQRLLPNQLLIFLLLVQDCVSFCLCRQRYIAFRARPSHPLSPHRKDQEGRRGGQSRERSDDEGILQPHVLDPGGDAVADGEAHGIADEDDGDDGLAGESVVCVDAVGDGQLERGEGGRGNEAHGDDGADPVDGVRAADTVEDQTARCEEKTRQEQPEAKLGF